MSAVGVTLIGSVIFALHLNAVAFDVGLSIFGGIGNVNGNGYGSREHPSNYWFDFLLFYSTIRNLKRTTLSASRFRFFRFVKVATTSLLAELYCLRGYFGTAGAADVSEVADPEGAP